MLGRGETERALEWSRRSLELYHDDMTTLVNGACLRSRLGLKDEAIDIIARAFSRGWGKRDWIDHDPDYDLLREDRAIPVAARTAEMRQGARRREQARGGTMVCPACFVLDYQDVAKDVPAVFQRRLREV